RGNGVYAQAVNMVDVEPEHRAAQEEAANLMPAVVENEAVPVFVDSDSRVGMFVKVGAVEVAERPFVCGKVRGHPVQNHRYSMLVQVIDQVHQVLRSAITAGGREISRRLI